MILRIRPSVKGQRLSQKLSAAKTSTKVTENTAAGIFQQMCASCHGGKMEGTTTAKGFVNTKFLHGSDKKSIIASITNGITTKGMPAWNGAIKKEDISKLADFIISKSKK